MKVLQEQKLNEVNGGFVPIVVAVVVYGELACFAAFFSGIATYNAIKNNKEEKDSQTLTKQTSDVLQSKINTMMQESASWLNNLGADNNQTKSGASATGYLQLGWMPRTADWSEFDPKFKVYLSLPR